MLRIESSGPCSGWLSRRNFLRVGSLGIGGLTLPSLLQAEAADSAHSKTQSVIHLFLGGGPSQSDIFPNLEAPENYRTSFRRIDTSVPGIRICEHLPLMASMAEKFVFLPGVHSMDGSHQPHCCYSGAVMSGSGATREKAIFGQVGGRPSQGSCISRLLGSSDGVTPPYMLVRSGNAYSSAVVGPGFLGGAFAPFQVQSSLGGDMRLNGITVDELNSRRKLLTSLDRLKAKIDSSGLMETMDQFSQKALDLVTSDKLANAVDLGKEDPKVVDKYTNRGWASRGFDSGVNLGLLRARRLVEAGARYVGVSYGGWDTHQANDEIHAYKLPILDAGLTTLIDDLDQRGMLDDVTLLVWGEMGRGKPYSKPTKDPATGLFGRGTGHWGEGAPAFMAGGGLRTGQMIGSLDRHGIHNKTRPVHNHEVLATIYHNLGIDVASVKITDPAGRPHYLLEHGRPIAELL